MIAKNYLKLYRFPMKGVCLEYYFPDNPEQSEKVIQIAKDAAQHFNINLTIDIENNISI